MKAPLVMFQILLCVNAMATEGPSESPVSASNNTNHRYLVERTFPRGALDELDTAVKAKVNANNASVGVRWLQSYANADLTKTYCIYEGPSEGAIRIAAALNRLPVDSIVEVPVDLNSASQPNAGKEVVKIEK